MHKLFLIAAMVLASATAQAGPRGLTVASNEEPVATEQGASEAPKYVARPSATTEPSKSGETKSEETKSTAAKSASAPRADKPRRRGGSTEARVIYELHRHGIYW
jgi:hypothetical protein